MKSWVFYFIRLFTICMYLDNVVVSCLGVWRWSEIAALLSNKRGTWRGLCCISLFITLFDVILAMTLILAIFSPLRWKLISECSYRLDNHVGYRAEVFGHCLLCLKDVVCVLVGSLSLLSFTGTLVVVYNTW